jgi:hypothetical protein
MKIKIKVHLKLFSGIERELGIENYNRTEGFPVEVNSGTRLRSVLKKTGMKDISSNVFFIEGERVSVWRKLKDGDIISCLKPSGGG